MTDKFLQIAWKHHPGATLETSVFSMESLDYYDFIADLEGEFGIIIDDEDLGGVETFGDVLMLVEKKI